MTRQVDAKNQVTCLYYDELNRPRGKDYFTNGAACPADPGSGYDVAYGYDSMANGNFGKGRRTSMSITGADFTQWTYDARGRVMSENKQITGGGQFVTSFTYNSADLPVTMTYPDGEIVNFAYNNNMLLTSMTGTNAYVQSTAYDSASRVTSRALGNGLTQTYNYYAWNQQGGRLQTLSTGSLQNFTYQYDSVGNILSIADSVNSQTQTFDYDDLDRLWHAGATGESSQGGYATETYEYNPATGNLETKAGLTYAYNSGHAHAVSSLSNGNSYLYDQNGNMTQRNADGQSFTFAYDAENRLISVSGDATASFAYDGDSKRIKSTMDGETTYFVGGHYEKQGSNVTKYYMAGASRVAMRKDGTLTYLLADHLGSSSISTDASGNRTSELRYKPWGETRFSYGTMPTKYQFTGQYAYTDDPSTPGSEGFGLMYYGARWVDPALSRFTQPDTMIPQEQGTQALDRYAYTNNNPVRYIDPTGHCILCVAAIAGVIVAAPFVLSGLGLRADVEGAMIASAVTMNQGRDILVTAGIAVQSEYPLAILGGDNLGWAQASRKELKGRNPFSPSVSAEIMGDRIYGAINDCKSCNDGKNDGVDRLIVAALAQNGFNFSPSGVGNLMRADEIDWDNFLDEQGSNPSAWYNGVRQDITDMNYDTQLRLKIYIQDLLLLMSMGYELPDWLTEEDIQYIIDQNYYDEPDDER